MVGEWETALVVGEVIWVSDDLVYLFNTQSHGGEYAPLEPPESR